MHPPTARLVALAAALCLLSPPAVRAGTITLISLDTGTPVAYNPDGSSAGAGPFHWAQADPPAAGYPPTLTTYCIDLDQFFRPGDAHTFAVQTDLQLAPTVGTDETAAAIHELFDRSYAGSLAGGDAGVAFQLALWELVYDGPAERSLAAGRIRSDRADAQALLDGLGGPYANHDLTGYRLAAFVSDVYQDQIGVVPVTTPVPAPPAAVLAGVGLLALVGRSRLGRASGA